MTPKTNLDNLIQSYGDLIFDLCQSLLASSANAEVAFNSILRKIRSASRFQKYSTYERAWVLRVTCDQLLGLSKHHGHRITPEEQIRIDASDKPEAKLEQFQFYFRRLSTQDQLLLLLGDKHSIPYSEMAIALATPEASLKMRRQQTLRTLEEWLWKTG